MKWVVEWSEEQQSFHTDTLENVIERNQRAYISGRTTQFNILCFATNIDHASELCDRFKEARRANSKKV